MSKLMVKLIKCSGIVFPIQVEHLSCPLDFTFSDREINVVENTMLASLFYKFLKKTPGEAIVCDQYL